MTATVGLIRPPELAENSGRLLEAEIKSAPVVTVSIAGIAAAPELPLAPVIPVAENHGELQPAIIRAPANEDGGIGIASVRPVSELGASAMPLPAQISSSQSANLMEARLTPVEPGTATTPEPARINAAAALPNPAVAVVSSPPIGGLLKTDDIRMNQLTNSPANRLGVASADMANPATNLTLATLVTYTFPVYFGLPFKIHEKQPFEPLTDEDLVPGYPLAVARSFTGSTPELLNWLTKWEANIQQGKLPPQDSGLTTILAGTSLTCTQLVAIGRGVECVEGFLGAAPFYRAAVAKAETELAGHGRNETRDAPVIHALICMGWFNDLQIHEPAVLERIFRLLVEHEPADSIITFQAEFLHAEMLYELGRGPNKALNLQAAEIYRAMLERPIVKQWPMNDQLFIRWTLACALYQGNHFDESVPEFRQVASSGYEPYTGWSRQYYISSLARAGRVKEARDAYSIWVTESKPVIGNIDHVSRLIDLMEKKYSRSPK